MFNLILYFLVFNLCIILSYFLGMLYFKFIVRRNSISNLFFVSIGEKILAGITILSSLIAIIKTYGLTTQSIIFLILLIPIFIKKKSTEKIQPITKKTILILIISSCFVFFFHWFGFYHLHDHVYYAKLGKAIFTHGIESTTALYYNFISVQGITLYHYSDIWLSEFISYLFFKNSIFSLTKVVYPLFHFIILITVFGLLIEKFKGFLKPYVISLLILLGTAILFYPLLTPEQGHHTFWHYGFPEVTSFKSLVIYPYLLLTLHYLTQNKFKEFIILISLVCIEYITVFIALFPSTNFLIISFLIFKQQNLKNTLQNIILFNSPLLLMFIITIIFKDNNTTNSSLSNITHVIYPIDFYIKNWIINLRLLFDYLLRPFYLYPIPSILIIFFYRKINKTTIYILFNFILASSIIVILNNLTNINQTLSLIIGPFMLFIMIEFLKYINNKIVKYLIFTGLFLTSVLNLKMINSLNDGEYKLKQFDRKLFQFAKKNLNNNNWCYYSEKPYSTWMYSAQISKSPLLLNNETNLGIEIAPFFNKNFNIYSKKNPDSPICSIKNDKIEFIKLMKKLKVRYIYIENLSIVNQNFKKHLTPILTNKNYGLYRISY